MLHQLGEVELDRLLVGVDLVLQRRDVACAAAVPLVEGQDRLAQHQLDLVGELQHRAGRGVQRQRRIVEQHGVEVVEALRLARRPAGSGKSRSSSSRRPAGQRQEDDDEPEVEERVEMRREPRRVVAEPRRSAR